MMTYLNYHVKWTVLLIVALSSFQINGNSQTVKTLIDYHNPDRGTFQLQYEFGNEYNPQLPTVIVIADAQQFYVREGRIKKTQDDLFGDGLNVLGIIPRGTNEELRLKANLNDGNQTDWKQSYTIFKAYQYANDIELIRTKVLSNDNEVYLYGQSGGAFLITEYLSIFPNAPIKKVFLGACVNPVIENKLGIVHDTFYRDYLSKNEAEKLKLDAILEGNYFDRKLIANLFQRQNFFVDLSELDEQRSELINRLYENDTTFVYELKTEYQINAINGFLESDSGIPIRVRLFEFIKPLGTNWQKNTSIFYPDLENSFNIAYPIEKMAFDNELSFTPAFNEEGFRNFKGEVFILSGRYDHVADYRSSIYLSGLCRKSTLFIANDDHTFKSLKAKGDYAKLIQDFFNSSNRNYLTLRYKSYQWKEQ